MNRRPSSPSVPGPMLSAARAGCRFPLVRGLILLTLFLLLPSSSLTAAPYALDWCTTDAGGGTSSGGDYALSGTIGQTDTAVISGDRYRVEGGFWPGLIFSSPAELPTLVLQLRDNHFWISWSPATPGFILEQTGDLSAPKWITAPTGNPAIVPFSANAQFYRLRKP